VAVRFIIRRPAAQQWRLFCQRITTGYSSESWENDDSQSKLARVNQDINSACRSVNSHHAPNNPVLELRHRTQVDLHCACCEQNLGRRLRKPRFA